LIDLVDDATSTTWAQLGEQETIWAVADALRAWIERYGVPQSVYVDWKNLYKRPATVKEQLRGEEPVTQFGRMWREAGDRGDRGQFAASQGTSGAAARHASGPAGEETAAQTNQQSRTSQCVFGEEYLPEHNQRFARAAVKTEDYHRGAPRAAELDRIFRLENARTISNDWVVRYHNRWLQLAPQSRHVRPRRTKCWCAKGGTGTSPSSIGGARWRWQEIPAPRKPIEMERKPASQPQPPRAPRKWCPRAATRGERRPGEESSNEKGSWQRCGAAVVGLAFRFALTAPPFGLRRATLQARPTTKKEQKPKKGHFLTR